MKEVAQHPYDHTITANQGEISAISLREDDLRLISTSKIAVKIWSRTSKSSTDWRIVQTIAPAKDGEGKEKSFTTASISKDGEYLAVGYAENSTDLYKFNKTNSQYEISFAFQEPSTVLAVTIAPDKQFFLTGGWNGNVHMWPTETNVVSQKSSTVVATMELKSLIEFKNHGHGVTCFAITSNCEKIIVGGWSQLCTVYSITKGSPGYQLKGDPVILEGHKGAIRCLTLTADDKYIITGSQDKTCKIWSIEGGGPLMNLTGHKGIINGVAVSPGITESSHMVIATASADGSCFLWNRYLGQKCREFLSDGAINMPCVAFSFDNQLLFATTNDGKIKVWNRHCTQTFVKYANYHKKPVAHAALSKDGRFVATSSADETCVVIDRKALSAEGIWEKSDQGHTVCRLKGHTNNVRSVALAHDSKYVATASWDQTCRIWDLQTGSVKYCLKSSCVVRTVVFSNDNRYVVVGGAKPNHVAVVWDFETDNDGKISGQIKDFIAQLQCFENRPASKCVTVLKGHKSEVTSVGMSVIEKESVSFVVTGSMDNSVIIWQLNDDVIHHHHKIEKAHDAPVRAVAIALDATFVVSGGSDNLCKIWNRETRSVLHVLEGHQESITSLFISYDDKLILSGSYDKTCRVWNRDSGKTIGVLSNHENWVNAVAISEDKSCIVTGSEDKTCNCFENLSFLASTKVAQSSVGDTLKILEADPPVVQEDDFLKLIFPPNLCEVIPWLSQSESQEDRPIESQSDAQLVNNSRPRLRMKLEYNNIVHQVVMLNNAELLKKLLQLNPIAVFVRIFNSQQDTLRKSKRSLNPEQDSTDTNWETSALTLLHTALKYDASKCIPIILQYYLYFLNIPNASGDKEEIHHKIHKQYFGLDMEQAGSDAHPFLLGESLIHPCEWIEIEDFHHLSKERKYASLYIEFVKSLKLLPQHPCVIGNREDLHNNLENRPKFAWIPARPLWNLVLRIAAMWEESSYHVLGSEERCEHDFWSKRTTPKDVSKTIRVVNQSNTKQSDTKTQESIGNTTNNNQSILNTTQSDDKSKIHETVGKENVPNLFPFLIPIKDIATKKSLFLDDAIEIAKREDRYDIFSSTVLEAVISYKWDTYVARYFYWDFAIFLIMYVAFIVNSLLFTRWFFNKLRYRNEFISLIVLVFVDFCLVMYFAKYEWDQLRSMIQRQRHAIETEAELKKNDQNTTTATVTTSTSTSTALVNKNSNDWCCCFDPAFQRAFADYVAGGWNWLDASSIAAMATSVCCQMYAMIVYSPLEDTHTERVMDQYSFFVRYAIVTGIAFPLVSVNMFFYMQGNQTTGALVRMIFKICYGSFSLCVILALITFGFAASFSVLFGNQHWGGLNDDTIIKAYGEYDQALLTVFGFIFANYEIPDVDSSVSPKLATILIVVFVAFVSIILLNLLIAIMGDRYAEVQENAKAESLYGKAELVMEYERKIFEHLDKENTDTNKDKDNSSGNDSSVVERKTSNAPISNNKTASNQNHSDSLKKKWKKWRNQITIEFQNQCFPRYLQVLQSESSSSSNTGSVESSSPLTLSIIIIWSNYFRSIYNEVTGTRQQIKDLKTDVEQSRKEMEGLRQEILELKVLNQSILELLKANQSQGLLSTQKQQQMHASIPPSAPFVGIEVISKKRVAESHHVIKDNNNAEVRESSNEFYDLYPTNKGEEPNKTTLATAVSIPARNSHNLKEDKFWIQNNPLSKESGTRKEAKDA